MNKNLKETLRELLKEAVRVEHKLIGKVAIGSHLSYYGLVAWEAHGTYRYAAGVVGLLMVVEACINHTPPGPPDSPA